MTEKYIEKVEVSVTLAEEIRAALNSAYNNFALPAARWLGAPSKMFSGTAAYLYATGMAMHIQAEQDYADGKISAWTYSRLMTNASQLILQSTQIPETNFDALMSFADLFSAMAIVGVGLRPVKLLTPVRSVTTAKWAQESYKHSEKLSETASALLTTKAKQPIITIDDLAEAFRSGIVKVDDVPVDMIFRHGEWWIVSTRTAEALTRAGIPRSQWRYADQSGHKILEQTLTEQLKQSKGLGTDRPFRRGSTLCFGGDTPVRMINGTYKKIKDIRVGDVVGAFSTVSERGRGTLLPGNVSRLYRDVSWTIPFFATRVTLGHHYLSEDGTYQPIASILESDGCVIDEDGVCRRARTGVRAYSADDEVVRCAWGSARSGNGISFLRAGNFFGLDPVSQKWLTIRQVFFKLDAESEPPIEGAKEIYWGSEPPPVHLLAGQHMPVNTLLELSANSLWPLPAFLSRSYCEP